MVRAPNEINMTDKFKSEIPVVCAVVVRVFASQKTWFQAREFWELCKKTKWREYLSLCDHVTRKIRVRKQWRVIGTWTCPKILDKNPDSRKPRTWPRSPASRKPQIGWRLTTTPRRNGRGRHHGAWFVVTELQFSILHSPPSTVYTWVLPSMSLLATYIPKSCCGVLLINLWFCGDPRRTMGWFVNTAPLFFYVRNPDANLTQSIFRVHWARLFFSDTLQQIPFN